MNDSGCGNNPPTPRPATSERNASLARERAQAIKKSALELGFDLAGIAAAASPETFPRLQEWLERGYAGEMGYLARREEAYEHPDRVMEGVRSIVLLGMNYGPPKELEATEGLKIARYARGKRDYHDVIRERLKQLGRRVKELVPGSKSRGIVDTAPLLERDFARTAGLGWFGKNTMLIHKKMGSWFFLAGLLTDLELEADAAFTKDHCGTCTRCLEACPTDAFTAPYVLDARRCISYLTIELKGEIPLDLREGIGEWMFGCDICQEVCPWNRKGPATREEDLLPLDRLRGLQGAEILELSQEEFTRQFGETPLARPGREGILRNAAIAAGNRGDRSVLPALKMRLEDESAVVREAAAWGVSQIEKRTDGISPTST